VPHLRLHAAVPLLRARAPPVRDLGPHRHADVGPHHEDRGRLLSLDRDRRHLLPLVQRRGEDQRRGPLLGRRRARAQTARSVVARAIPASPATPPSTRTAPGRIRSQVMARDGNCVDFTSSGWMTPLKSTRVAKRLMILAVRCCAAGERRGLAAPRSALTAAGVVPALAATLGITVLLRPSRRPSTDFRAWARACTFSTLKGRSGSGRAA